MGLKHRDLENTVLSRLSIDEYEPKTGDAADVMVLGIRVIDESPGKDLYGFINSSTIKVRDVDVSPNPDLESNYWVFVEMEREPGCLDQVRELIADIEHVSGPLKWRVKTHLSDQEFALNGAELEQYVIQDPDQYQTREEFEASIQEDQQESDAENQPELEVGHSVQITDGALKDLMPTDTGVIMGFETQGDTQFALLSMTGAETDETVPVETEYLQLIDDSKQLPEQDIISFLKNSNASVQDLSEGVLTLHHRGRSAVLEVIDFGAEHTVLKTHGLHESAVHHGDSRMAALNSMLGEARAVWIGEHIVLYNAGLTDVIVTKPC